MSKIPALANSVTIGGKTYLAGTVPPLEVAKKITNGGAWPDEKVPDFDGASDSDETAKPVSNTERSTPAGLLGGDAALPAGDNPDADFEALPEGKPTDGGFGQAPAPEPAEAENEPVDENRSEADGAPAEETTSAPKPAKATRGGSRTSTSSTSSPK
jgi:hypothetical protein